MKKEDEELFSKKLHELADKFNQAVIEPRPGCCPEDHQCMGVDPKAAEEFNALSEKTYAEFTQAGYDADDWNELMRRSGAGKRMGLGP